MSCRTARGWSRCEWRTFDSPESTPLPPPALPLSSSTENDWPRNPSQCIAAADNALCNNPADWPALYARARAACALGKPHRALSDLARIFSGSADSAASKLPPVDATIREHATDLFERISKLQKEVLENMACIPDRQRLADTPTVVSERESKARGKSSMCIYKVATGNLLFRDGVRLNPSEQRNLTNYPACKTRRLLSPRGTAAPANSGYVQSVGPSFSPVDGELAIGGG